MYLLDTNVVSEVRKNKPHGAVLAWLAATPESSLFISAVTCAEIQRGVELTRDQNPAKAAELDHWLDQLGNTYRLLPVDDTVFRSHARLMHRYSDDHYVDGLIAATALVHRLTVVTRNLRDFEPFGVTVFNPFASKPTE